MWKSPRPKHCFEANSEEDIRSISTEVFKTDYEKRKIELLTKLRGVRVPTASAILTIADPENYGIIDIRVWRVLFVYGAASAQPSGLNLNFNNWYTYLMKLRYYAERYKTRPRDIEQVLFNHHLEIHTGKLYK